MRKTGVPAQYEGRTVPRATSYTIQKQKGKKVCERSTFFFAIPHLTSPGTFGYAVSTNCAEYRRGQSSVPSDGLCVSLFQIFFLEVTYSHA